MNKLKQFWEAFSSQDFNQAQGYLMALSEAQQQIVLAELFQKASYARQPDVISVLYRHLHESKSFEDFHEAWLPEENNCQPTHIAGQTIQNYFPAPTRVYNALNMKNPHEIVSVGLTWFDDKAQAKQMWAFATPDNPANQARASSIAKVADKISAEVFETKTQDDLGCAFLKEN